jgi:ribonuclease J
LEEKVISKQKTKDSVKIIPLGGLEEIGKNMTAIEYNNEIVVIDSGMSFPGEDLPGVDCVIPDITYLANNREKVKGIVLTHGHEDHIGGLPYVLRDLHVPVYGTRLTIGLVEPKLKEAHNLGKQRLVVVKHGEAFRVGNFKVELIKTCHSIPDASAIAIHTPLGVIFHTGDFKFDQTPVDGRTTDFQRIAEISSKGVLVMMSDSTNAIRPGFSMSESSVGDTFEKVFPHIKGRIILATFASNVHRLQQVLNVAAANKRKVVVTGRSMVNTIGVASENGYLDVPPHTLIEIEEMNQYPANKLVVLCTGSQGEPMAALSRMAMNEHRQIHIGQGDTVIFSANPIPGNEKLVSRVVDMLFKLGANVIDGSEERVHVSGHAAREELKMMINLVRPKYFMPVHGEYRMLKAHAQLAKEVGIPAQNIIVAENGCVVQAASNKISITGRVPAGRVLIDGLGVGDVGNIVLRDRKQLAEDGIFIVVATIDRKSRRIVAGPDIVSRGFVYVRESDALMGEARKRAVKALEQCLKDGNTDWNTIKSSLRDACGKYIYEKTRRRPMMLPIIMEEE